MTNSLPHAVERKITLNGRVLEYDCQALEVIPNERAVLRYVVEGEMEVGNRPFVVTAGTISIAHYWAGRPYNVYHWLDGERTLALYCNAGQTLVIVADCVVYRDLELDVLILPTGEAPPGSPDSRHRVGRHGLRLVRAAFDGPTQVNDTT